MGKRTLPVLNINHKSKAKEKTKMSRSNNTELINPAVRFFDWKGDGHLQYFDKTLGDKGENVTVDLPFTFLILDCVFQVTGGIDDNSGYLGFWSNCVKNLKTQKLIVRSKRGIEFQGLYEDIKGETGVKFMTGLYIAFKDEGELKIGYLKIKGAALTAWIDFSKQHRNIYEGAFQIIDKAERKKGSNTYYEPVFRFNPTVTEETDNVAKMLDMQLQEYLTAYFANAGIQEAEQEYTAASPATSEPNALQQAMARAERSLEPVPDDYHDDSNIPF